jgi:uncharacterized protein
MVEDRIHEIVLFFEEKLKASGLNIKKVVLFGSAYRGEMTKDSDIDIAIISDDFIGKTVSERARLAGDAFWETTSKFKIALDVIKLTSSEYENETRMIASYIKEGKVIYSAE